ncbi:MAG: DUF4129 domain-containing protein [Symbiobacterium sp.]|uniref:DUF4129 domain-containing protein n=1 Tax=Symbiobacterium sp. TaxID=1971213 RepID=UPI0034644202
MARFWRSSGTWLPWLLAGVVEVAAVTPWLLLLYAAADDPAWLAAVPGLWLPLAVFLTAAVWQSVQQGDRRWMRVVGLLAGTALAYLAAYALLPGAQRAGLLAANPAVAFIPVAVYLWFRSARLAIEGLAYGPVSDRVGPVLILQLAGIILLLAVGRGRESAVHLLLFWSVVALFAAGLTLLALLRERAPAEGGPGAKTVGTPASPAVTWFVVALVAVTAVASQFLTVDRLDAVVSFAGRLLAPLYNLVVAVVLFLARIVGYLIAPLVALLARLMTGYEPPEQQGEGEVEIIPPDPVPERGPALDLGPLLQAIALLAALAVVAVWLYRLTAVRRRSMEADEERVSLGFWSSLRQDLLALFRRRSAPRAGETGPAEEAVPPGSPRALFRQLQAWGAQRGRPRRPAETPNTYQVALAAAEPSAGEASAAVTAVYNQARYGPVPPEPEAVARAARLLRECCAEDAGKTRP